MDGDLQGKSTISRITMHFHLWLLVVTGVALVGSLKAPSDAALPIRFWQLYSVLGNDKIESIVKDFYSMVRTPKPLHHPPSTLHPTP
jgi:hypothetical protein